VDDAANVVESVAVFVTASCADALCP